MSVARHLIPLPGPFVSSAGSGFFAARSTDRLRACSLALCLVVLLSPSSAPQRQDTAARADLLKPGGSALTYAVGRFGDRLLDAEPISNRVARGRDLYVRDWLDADATGRPAAGPDLDASGCAACHIETAPRAAGADAALAEAAPMVARPVHSVHEARYGAQLTQRRHDTSTPESRHHTRWISVEFVYASGERRRLRRPVTTAHTRAGEVIPVSLRVAPLLFGWGLIEQVPARTLAAFDDPGDRDGDGISGRMISHGEATAFLGWKNAQSSLRGQVAAALFNDMGINDPGATTAEISAGELDDLVAYVAQLGVPARRSSPVEQQGDLLFGRTGCAACHVPALITADTGEARFADQLIWPYSDLMLHDMGPGLADDGDRSDAAEWRTAPLWGVGLVEAYFPGRGFLHDGRARDLEEAILWHDGEARRARDRFARLPRRERDVLLAYVRSL